MLLISRAYKSMAASILHLLTGQLMLWQSIIISSYDSYHYFSKMSKYNIKITKILNISRNMRDQISLIIYTNGTKSNDEIGFAFCVIFNDATFRIHQAALNLKNIFQAELKVIPEISCQFVKSQIVDLLVYNDSVCHIHF